MNNSLLSSEILHLVASSLSVDDILHLCSSNRQWAQVCEDDFFWKQITLRDFPYPLVRPQETWKEVYRENWKLSRTPTDGKFFYVVISEPFDNGPNFLGLKGNARILYLWLRNYLRLRKKLYFSDITLEALPESPHFEIENRNGFVEVFFEYKVYFPQQFTNQLQVEKWFDALKYDLEKDGSGQPKEILVSNVAYPPSPMRVISGTSTNSDGTYYVFFNPISAFMFDSNNRLFLQREDEEQLTEIPY
nr:hypothetical protein pmam_220 [Pithovirus mammoth]